jgi:hypothetical protein
MQSLARQHQMEDVEGDELADRKSRMVNRMRECSGHMKPQGSKMLPSGQTWHASPMAKPDEECDVTKDEHCRINGLLVWIRQTSMGKHHQIAVTHPTVITS